MNFVKTYVIFLGSVAFIIISCSDRIAETKDNIRIGFSQCFSDHPWRDAMNHSMRIQASLYPEVELEIYEAHNDIQRQIEHVEKMINDGVDVLIISPIETDMIVPALEKAYDLGIPIILIDRKINSQKYSSYVGGDNLEVGRNAGNYIISSTLDKANVIELMGGDKSTPVMERSKGFRQIVSQAPSIVLLKSLKGIETGIPKEQFSTVLDSLGQNNIDYIYAFNDQLALQAWQVAREKGLEKQIKFIGVDGLNGPNGGIDLVREGILEATILYPTGGAEAIEMAMEIVAGKEVPKDNILNTTVIDLRNADMMKNQFDKINNQQLDIEQQIAALRILEERYFAQNTLMKVTMALLAIILSLTFYSIYSIFAIRKKNRQLQLTNKKVTVQRNQIKKIADELKQTSEAKYNFFTGISHEFKTPITLILSSLESIREMARAKGSRIVEEVELINNNSNRLLRLINNLLDFRKVEDRKFNLTVSHTNLFAFSKSVYEDFKHEAKRRNISFEISCNNKDLEVYLDRNLMDKVYFNLLSNAFKFTPDNGRVHIVIHDEIDKNTVTVSFKDTGIGIPKKELANIFQPFFKGSNNRKNSTGIGLHLSKEFVELHKGTLVVSSVHGTDFSMTLKKGNTHFDEDEIIQEPDLVDEAVIEFNQNAYVEDAYRMEEIMEDQEQYCILIIEDNPDLLSFLEKKLKVEFDINLSDGTDAVEKALEIIPDIIICDLILPDKNGFEICEILKKDLRTSHVPIIVLTAMNDKQSYLQGLQSGADLYLTKPFSYSILVQSIKSLLYNREKLRFYYTNNIYKIEQTDSFGNLEQQFINTLNTIIKENLDNSDFSVEQLADTLHVSRVQLYRKVKAILGLSISDYISNFRLEKAKTMLEITSLSISEIAYGNGFSSPNYFSTSFKNKFGNSPAAYRKVHGIVSTS